MRIMWQRTNSLAADIVNAAGCLKEKGHVATHAQVHEEIDRTLSNVHVTTGKVPENILFIGSTSGVTKAKTNVKFTAAPGG